MISCGCAFFFLVGCDDFLYIEGVGHSWVDFAIHPIARIITRVVTTTQSPINFKFSHLNGCDLRRNSVTNQAVSFASILSESGQARRTVAGGVAMSAVGPALVIELPPAFDEHLGLGAAADPFAV